MATYQGLTLADALGILEKAGYTSSVREETAEMAVIRSQIHGLTFLVFLTAPNGNGRFETLQLFIGFLDQVDPAAINAWNGARRFARAYISAANGSPSVQLESDLYLVDVGEAHITWHLQMWSSIVADFAQFMSDIG